VSGGCEQIATAGRTGACLTRAVSSGRLRIAVGSGDIAGLVRSVTRGCPRIAARAVDRIALARASSGGCRRIAVSAVRAGASTAGCPSIVVPVGILFDRARACRRDSGLLGAKRSDPLEDRFAVLVLALVSLDLR
jgi:hypothetical protein